MSTYEIPDIFRHFMKCLTSWIACNIYTAMVLSFLRENDYEHVYIPLRSFRSSEKITVSINIYSPTVLSFLTENDCVHVYIPIRSFLSSEKMIVCMYIYPYGPFVPQRK